MVVSQANFLECAGFSLRRLAGLLRQFDYEERFNRQFTHPDGVCCDRRGDFRVRLCRRREAQRVGLPEAIHQMG